MKKQLGCLSTAVAVTVLVVLLTIGLLGLLWGGSIFSSGPLNAQSGSASPGGVPTHAALGGRCSACHVAPWNRQTMADRCLGCHTQVTAELQTSTSLHGAIAAGGKVTPCYSCHPEHRGATASLTVMDGKNFDHSKTAFPLTGAHLSVACTRCHVNSVFQGTPTDCLSCHPDPAYHAGLFGADCASCHTTSGWTPARFDAAHAFPLDHGRAGGVCQACHPSSLSAYTCYAGCHVHNEAEITRRHQEEGITDIQDCARCHLRGRGEER